MASLRLLKVTPPSLPRLGQAPHIIESEETGNRENDRFRSLHPAQARAPFPGRRRLPAARDERARLPVRLRGPLACGDQQHARPPAERLHPAVRRAAAQLRAEAEPRRPLQARSLPHQCAGPARSRLPAREARAHLPGRRGRIFVRPAGGRRDRTRLPLPARGALLARARAGPRRVHQLRRRHVQPGAGAGDARAARARVPARPGADDGDAALDAVAGPRSALGGRARGAPARPRDAAELRRLRIPPCRASWCGWPSRASARRPRPTWAGSSASPSRSPPPAPPPPRGARPSPRGLRRPAA